ncbi:MAG TPA: nucleotidyltransferase substrate binding protein [Prolixibacteraceae bacterium]|nr:nucleotidyltransferase substrate binding protein [Lentimicrobium sp.]HLN72402.1 nucleotidyltransferase substrate binding protein [Prolixibacteraceae bacterium]
MSEDIRWKQRFINFEKSTKHLESALNIPDPDIIHKAGIIQFFEMTYELGWKLLKDYLEYQGFNDVGTPRKVIKTAFEAGLVNNGHLWMELMLDRNLTAHTYDEERASEVEVLIHQKYFPILKELYETFRIKNNE